MLVTLLVLAMVGWIAFLLLLIPFLRRSKVLRMIAFGTNRIGQFTCPHAPTREQAATILYDTSFIWEEEDNGVNA